MSHLLVGFAWIVGVVIVLATSATLPPVVATHFGWGGRANGFMSREAYQVFYCGLLAFMTLVIHASFAWLPGRIPSLVNLPNRDHWLEPAREEQTLATLRSFGAAMTLLILAFLVGVHLLVVEAHSRTPPTLDEPVFLTALGGFVMLLVGLLIAMMARFRVAR